MVAGAIPPGPLLYTGGQWAIVLGILAAGLGLKAAILWWLYRDCRARGANPVAWVLTGIPFDLIVLVVWLVRRPEPWRRNAPPPAPPPADPAPSAAPRETYHVGFQPRSETPAPPASDQLRVTCPNCAHRFVVARNPDGPTPLRCPECGTSGRL